MNAVRVAGLSYNFGDVRALESVDVEVAEGDLFGIIGPDSAGKTTLLRSLCTLLPIQVGEVEVLGMNPAHDQKRIRAAIGYMPQRFSLYQDLTVEENLGFFARLFGVGRADYHKRSVELNKFSHLEAFAKRKAGALSGGMKQKLALSCALIHTPRLLILDEPTFGVDPVSRMELWNILHELNSGGMSIVVSTSYMDEAEQCDRVALMHSGRIMQCDHPQALIDGFPAKLYRITGSDLGAVRDFLKAQPGLRGIQLFGGEIHLMSDSAIAASTFTDWKQKCPSLQGWEAISPVMEDVFLEQMHDN